MGTFAAAVLGMMVCTIAAVLGFSVGRGWPRDQRSGHDVIELANNIREQAEQLRERRLRLNSAVRSLAHEINWRLFQDDGLRAELDTPAEILRYTLKLLMTHNTQLGSIIEQMERANRRAQPVDLEKPPNPDGFGEPRHLPAAAPGLAPESRQDPQPYPSYKRTSARSTDCGRGADDTMPRSESAVRRADRSAAMVQVLDLYNRAVEDHAAREQFRDLYQPTRIGTLNTVERRLAVTLPAEFDIATAGDFLALEIDGSGDYWVFPRLGLTIEAVSYGAGALGEVFAHTQGYESTGYYSRYRVRQPAVFQRSARSWQLMSPGALDLGPSA